MQSKSYTAGFNISQPIEKVFPLFSPEGEKLWVPGWDYKNIMGTTELSEDYVFLTANHDHAFTDAVWLVKKYKPEKHIIEFYRVEPDNKVGVVKIFCSELNNSITHIEVTYKYMPLSEKGNEFIEGFTKENYAAYIDEWKSLLNKYFKNF